ncbi:putative quinol monooxygenase [Kordiimonas sp.]|uniref:putative quinol monooxygenase n=1 Tax=Kordiimonas sp. TaxID=1970157 RepID=UPI003A8CAFB7
MFGLIGKFAAKTGTRNELAAILLEGISGMPGCLSYVVAADPKEENTLWITEVWDSQQSHEASLSLPSVQEAIKRGRPLIEGMEMVATTRPVGGHGLTGA